MSRPRKLAGVLTSTVVAVTLTTTGVSGLAQASPKPATSPLAGSVVPFTAHTPAIGDVAASTPLTIQLWLKPDVAAAQRYATAVSTPGSSLFHRYLSPAAYTARFGASRASAAAVESWLRSKGFTAVHTDAQRNYVRATAPAKTIDAAFRTRLKLYKPTKQVNAGRYALRANDSPVRLPASVARQVVGVTGLDNAAPVLPLERYYAPAGVRAGQQTDQLPKGTCETYYGQSTVSGLPEMFGTTTFGKVICGYSGTQLRTVYGASTVSKGTGQTIALVELGLAPDMFRTLSDYAAHNGLPAPSDTRYAELSLGANTCGDPFFEEEQLDVEMSYDMAPGASQLVVGGDACNTGDFGLQGLLDADTAVLNGAGGHPLASVASNSWESGTEGQAPEITNIEHAYLVRAAAEGVGMYFSSGDFFGVGTPSSDPYAIAVGGTTLGIGKAGGRLFETGWSTGVSAELHKGHWTFEGPNGGAGGGPSLLWKQPAYQKGVVPAALARAPGNRGGPVRSVPDISAEADIYTGVAVGLLGRFKPHGPLKYFQTPVGGTSVAAPLVAGMVIAAQQGQRKPFGFTDPVLYKLAGTSAFYDTRPETSRTPGFYRALTCVVKLCGIPLLGIFDDQSTSMVDYTGQVTLRGYDNMSGLGTPNGADFIAGLRKLAG